MSDRIPDPSPLRLASTRGATFIFLFLIVAFLANAVRVFANDGVDATEECFNTNYAVQVYASSFADLDQAALCAPDGERASIDPRENAVLILDFGTATPLVPGDGWDLYFYEWPNPRQNNHILLDHIQISVARDDGLGTPVDPQVVFIWGDGITSNNGNLASYPQFANEGNQEEISPDKLENGRAIGIEVGSDSSMHYRFVIVEPFLVPGEIYDEDRRPEVDAFERIHPAPPATLTPEPSATLTQAPPSPTSTSDPTATGTNQSTETPSASETQTATVTPVPIIPSTSTPSDVPSVTLTPGMSPTATVGAPTLTASPEAPTATLTEVVPTSTIRVTPTPSGIATPTASHSPTVSTPTAQPNPSTSTVSATFTPTLTSTPDISATAVVSQPSAIPASPLPTATSTDTPIPSLPTATMSSVPIPTIPVNTAALPSEGPTRTAVPAASETPVFQSPASTETPSVPMPPTTVAAVSPNRVRFVQLSSVVDEGEGVLEIEIKLDRPADRDLNIHVYQKSGDALERQDYKWLERDISIRKGEQTAFVRLFIEDDLVTDGVKLLQLGVNLVEGDFVIDEIRDFCNIEIRDDDKSFFEIFVIAISDPSGDFLGGLLSAIVYGLIVYFLVQNRTQRKGSQSKKTSEQSTQPAPQLTTPSHQQTTSVAPSTTRMPQATDPASTQSQGESVLPHSTSAETTDPVAHQPDHAAEAHALAHIPTAKVAEPAETTAQPTQRRQRRRQPQPAMATPTGEQPAKERLSAPEATPTKQKPLPTDAQATDAIQQPAPSPQPPKPPLQLSNPAEAPAQTRRSVRRRININKASLHVLERKLGISREIAQRIVAYRDEKGRYQQVEELKQVLPGWLYDELVEHLMAK